MSGSDVGGSERLIEDCERCGGPIDPTEEGHYKSPDEMFVHKVCFEEGSVPDGPVADLSDEYPFLEHVPKTYNCGHYAIGPPSKTPVKCPECGVPAP